MCDGAVAEGADGYRAANKHFRESGKSKTAAIATAGEKSGVQKGGSCCSTMDNDHQRKRIGRKEKKKWRSESVLEREGGCSSTLVIEVWCYCFACV